MKPQLLLLLLLCACPDRTVTAVPPGQTGEETQVIPFSVNRKIDILFVIDNSISMGGEQTALAANFGRFMEVLNGIEGGLPDVHIGVVSSNVGAGGFGIDGCGGEGDDGRLQGTARGACAPPDGLYISDEIVGGARVKNYSGTLEESFSCIAQLGTSGCGLEQHLESMKRALDGSQPANTGFLRPDAWLAVVVIADEDDCSAQNGSLFNPSTSAQTQEEFGPMALRCTEWGVSCDGGNIARAPGSYSECVAREDSPYLWHPREYASFLKNLKGGRDLVMVAGIVGRLAPFEIGFNSQNQLALQSSCPGSTGAVGDGAVPAVRFGAFFDEFPGRATVADLCGGELADALTQIAEQMRLIVGTRCLSANADLTDIFTDAEHPGVQPACSVTEVQWRDTPEQSETVIGRCQLTDTLEPVAGGERPCWYIVEDAECEEDTSGFSLQIARDVEPPPGTDIVIRCPIAK